MKLLTRHLIWLLVVCCWGSSWHYASGAQTVGVTTRYVYDANGRLRAVITPEGAGIYEYDPAGNFTRIRRLLPTDCELLEFTPRQGPPGTLVTLYGIGFGANPVVTLNGQPATVVTQTATTLVVRIPLGAETGTWLVSTTCGSKSFPTPFTVSGIQVTPAALVLGPNRTTQFTALVAGLPDPSVSWSVNELVGGNEANGMISASGRYDSPGTAPAVATVIRVRATSLFDPAIFGEANVTLTGSGYEVRTAPVTVRYGAPTQREPVFANASLTVRYGVPLAQGLAFVRAPLSVRYGNVVTSLSSNLNSAVTVRYATPTPTAPAFVRSGLSVTRGPVLTSVQSGAPVQRGSTLPLTLQGMNLRSPSTLQFFQVATGQREPGLTATALTSNADGTVVTATLTLGPNVAAGRYVMQLTTASGQTVLADLNANTITVLP